MHSTSFSKLIFIVCVLLAFTTGVGVERYRAHQALARCHALNVSLTDDLTRAVTRGLEMETNLNLCKDQKNDR